MGCEILPMGAENLALSRGYSRITARPARPERRVGDRALRARSKLARRQTRDIEAQSSVRVP